MSDIIELEKRIAWIESALKTIESALAAFKIDKQMMMQADNNIKPGIGTKVSYDKYGRITGTLSLALDDIPTIPTDKISGLSNLLEGKANKSEITALTSKMESVGKHTRTVKTGSVVNVDENGLVNDVSDLTPDLIPELPLAKINGLTEIIDQLRQNGPIKDSFDHPSVVAGTGCKVTYDEYGHVTCSQPLTLDDIPSSIDSRLNRIESRLAEMALRTDLNDLVVAVNNKMDIPENKLKSGTYTKITVNENGLVSGVDDISANDVPIIPISSVSHLNEELASKATLDNMEELSNNLQSRIHNAETQQPTLPPMPSIEEFRQLKHSNEQLLTLVETLLSKIPGDQILAELDDVKQELSTVSGRLSVLESNSGE